MLHGILNIRKEKGYTSHDVVAKLRGIAGQKKIGHTGTLDPDAEGVLPVCLGKATKLCGMLTDQDKTYETVMLLGKTTDTQDISGSVIKESPLGDLDDDRVRACIGEFEGDYLQTPPMYSALKVNGKKLYELARKGIEVERKKRPVVIYKIRILQLQLPRVRMEVACSKGTYIRTLCHDIGQRLGCGACMEELTRTKMGAFSIQDSLTLPQVEEKKENGQLEKILVPVDQMFADYMKITVKDAYAALVCNGNPIRPQQVCETAAPADGEQVRVYDESGTFLAIYAFSKADGYFRTVKMFFDRNGLE